MVSDDEKKSGDDSRFRELSPGKLLVWARERAGLTQEQVAKELYVTLTKVRALESDDYRHMGAGTFIRGYLRAYANLLKLDVAQVLGAYDRHAQKYGLAEQVLAARVESANKPLWQFILLVLLALLILWLVSIWFFDNRQQPTYDRPMAVVPPAETALSAQSLNESGVIQSSSVASAALMSVGLYGERDVSDALNNSSASALNSSVAHSSVSSLADSVKPSIQGADSQLDSISLTFNDECWVEVSDTSGDVLVADLQRAGSHLLLQGEAPFYVKLGNAPAAKIELNGKEIAIVPVTDTLVFSGVIE